MDNDLIDRNSQLWREKLREQVADRLAEALKARQNALILRRAQNLEKARKAAEERRKELEKKLQRTRNQLGPGQHDPSYDSWVVRTKEQETGMRAEIARYKAEAARRQTQLTEYSHSHMKQIDAAMALQNKELEGKRSVAGRVTRLLSDTKFRNNIAKAIDESHGVKIPAGHLKDPGLLTNDEIIAMLDASTSDKQTGHAIISARVRLGAKMEATKANEKRLSSTGPDLQEIQAKANKDADNLNKAADEQAVLEGWKGTSEAERVEGIVHVIHTVNPYGPQGNSDDLDIIGVLAEDPDAIGVRFVDKKGKRVDEKGRPYTADDYINGDVPLDVDKDSLDIAIGKALPQTLTRGKSKNDRVGRPGAMTAWTLESASPGEMMIRFMALQDQGPQGKMVLAEYQKRLENGGFLQEGDYVPGTWGTNTQGAFEDFVGFAYPQALAQRTLGGGSNIDDILKSQEGNKAAALAAANAGGGGGGGGSAWAVTDEVALNMIADQAGQSLLGRNLTQDERASIVTKIKGLENAEGAKSAGAIQSIDPSARAEDLIRQMLPNDTKAHDMAGAFDMFAGLLGEGMGLGSSTPAFGASTVGTNTAPSPTTTGF